MMETSTIQVAGNDSGRNDPARDFLLGPLRRGRHVL